MPSRRSLKLFSTASAIDAAALPAAATKVRPRGGGGRCGARILSGSAAATAARKLSSRSWRMVTDRNPSKPGELPFESREFWNAQERAGSFLGRAGLDHLPRLVARPL